MISLQNNKIHSANILDKTCQDPLEESKDQMVNGHNVENQYNVEDMEAGPVNPKDVRFIYELDLTLCRIYP